MKLIFLVVRYLAAALALLYAAVQAYIVIGYRFFSDGARGFDNLELFVYEVLWVVGPVAMALWLLRGRFK